MDLLAYRFSCALEHKKSKSVALRFSKRLNLFNNSGLTATLSNLFYPPAGACSIVSLSLRIILSMEVS